MKKLAVTSYSNNILVSYNTLVSVIYGSVTS